MTTFALVHGGAHGGWCWDVLIPRLQARGHDAVAVDLPADDPDATWADYEAAAVAPLAGVGDDVVVVGHSLGGYTIPLVAARRPVRGLVYLCANIPEPGKGILDQVADDPGAVAVPRGVVRRDELGRTVFTEDGARQAFFHDVDDPTLVEWAVSRLRPQALVPHRLPYPLGRLPDVPAAYVLCRDDRALSPAWSRAHARRLLGLVPIELDGGHSPFLAQPDRLADTLVEVAAGARR